MAQPLNRDEFLTHMALLRDGIAGVQTRLDALNGRTREAEQDIAVLKERSGSDVAARTGGVVGGILGGAALIWQYFKP